MDEIDLNNIYQNPNGTNQPSDNNYHINQPQQYQENTISILPSKLDEEASFGIKLVFFLIGFIGFQFIGAAVSLIVLPLSLNNALLSSALTNLLSYIITFIIFIVILSVYKGGKLLKLVFSGFKRRKTYLWGFLLLGAAMLIETILSIINTSITNAVNPNANSTNMNEESIKQIMQSSYSLMMIFPVVLFAPFIEEFAYRFGLIGLFGKNNKIRGLIISSIIFGLLHFNGLTILLEMIVSSIPDSAEIFKSMGLTLRSTSEYGYLFLVEILNLPIYMLMGACLGLAYLVTGEISASIIAHATNNLLSTLIYFVSGTYAISIPEFFVKLANFSLSPYLTNSFFFFNK